MKTNVQASYALDKELHYLYNKPRYIKWKVITGSKISFYESYDLVYDDKDLRIRRLNGKI